jgi:hypothetical protein
MPSGYQVLPPLEDYKSKGAKKIRQLADELEGKRQDVGRLENEVEAASRDLEEAKGRDVQERALAARKGDKDPGRVHEGRANERLAELRDELTVMRQVEANVEEDLAAAITKHKGEILEEARAKRDEIARTYTEAFRRLRQVHDEQRRHAGVAKWAYAPSSHFSPASPNGHVLSVPDTLPADDPEHPPEVVGLRGA